MNTGFAAEPDMDEVLVDFDGIEDFLDYVDSPSSFGLDGMRSELRHMVLLMMELQGYETGYRSQQMLGFGHTGLIMNGILPSDLKKRREEEEFWDRFYKMLMELEGRFETIILHTQKHIRTVRDDIIAEVEAIDARIAAQADSDTQAEALKAGHERRTVLKWLKRRLERHEENLQQADTAAEAIEVHQKMEQDLKDVQEGNVSVNKAANRPSPFQQISDFVRARQENAPPEPRMATHNSSKPDSSHTESDDSKESAGKSGKGGQGGKSGKAGETGSGSGAGEKDDLPPPPVTPGGF